jgi:hypothetical protein
MTNDTTPTNPHRGHPEGTVYQTEAGHYWLKGRFGSIGLDGPEPTDKDLAHLEENDYPNGRDIFFVPVTTADGEVCQLDLPTCCHELAARSGIPNELMAQHFVDVAYRKTIAFLPMPQGSDRKARQEQITIISEMVGFSRGFGNGPVFCSLDAVTEHRDAERARGAPGITDAMVRLYLDYGPRQSPWPDEEERRMGYYGDDEAEHDVNSAICERVRAAAWDWWNPDPGPNGGRRQPSPAPLPLAV